MHDPQFTATGHTPSSRRSLALSTMWGIGRFERLVDFFEQAGAMGFTRFELNHKVTSQMLAAVDLGVLSIAVVHEPCPADVDTNLVKTWDWLISSLDEARRTEGVRLVRRSLELAHQLGAQVVVVHCGHIPGLRAQEDRLWRLYRAGKAASTEYQQIRERLLRVRAERTPPVLEAVRRSLSELSEIARPWGIRLGLENRYHYSDFPGLADMEALLASLDEERVGFWYDVGHAQTLDRLGFYPHQAWLERFGQRLVGAHLHDVQDLDDHFAPGLGQVDWGMVAAHLPAGIPLTLEVQHFNTPEQIRAGVQHLVDHHCLSDG